VRDHLDLAAAIVEVDASFAVRGAQQAAAAVEPELAGKPVRDDLAEVIVDDEARIGRRANHEINAQRRRVVAVVDQADALAEMLGIGGSPPDLAAVGPVDLREVLARQEHVEA
jgi:hypothetical protein